MPRYVCSHRFFERWYEGFACSWFAPYSMGSVTSNAHLIEVQAAWQAHPTSCVFVNTEQSDLSMRNFFIQFKRAVQTGCF